MTTTTAEPSEGVLTEGMMPPAKAAAFSGFSRTAIYAAMADRSLAYFEKPGRGRLIAKKELIAWMEIHLKPSRA